MAVAGGGHESNRQPGGRGVEPCCFEDGDDLVDVVELGQMQLLDVGGMPLCHQRAGRVHTHDRVVHAPERQGVEHRTGVGGEIVEQIEHLVAEGRIEGTPPAGDRIGGLEVQWPPPGELPGVFDRPRGRVVAEPLGYTALVGEQPEEPSPVAAGVEDPSTGEVNVDRLEEK